jgi:hypothetical protein
MQRKIERRRKKLKPKKLLKLEVRLPKMIDIKIVYCEKLILKK